MQPIALPGALCGAAFAAGIFAQLDARVILPGGLAAAAAALLCVARCWWAAPAPSPRLRAQASVAAARRIVIAMVFFLVGAVRYDEAAVDEPPAFPGDPVTVVGTVVRPVLPGAQRHPSAAEARSTVDIRCRAWHRPIRVRAHAALAGVRGGDTIRVTGRVARPLERRNPGDIDLPGRLALEVERRESVVLADFDGQHCSRLVGRVRQHLYDVAARVYSEPTRGYLLALLLGDRRLLAPRLRTSLLDTGTYHFLAISGLHLGLIMFVVLRIPLPRRARLPLRLLFLAGFAALTGAHPPVLRAALLFGLTLLCRAGERLPRPFNTLGWTGLLVLAWDPAAVREIGFQLSFVAVAALAALCPRLALAASPPDHAAAPAAPPGASQCEARAAPLLSALWRSSRSFLAMSIAAFLGTSPLILHYFHRLHPLAPLWNLIFYPFLVATLLGGVASLALGGLAPDLARPIAGVVDVLVEALAALTEWAGEIPGSTLYLAAPGPVALVLCYLLLTLWATRRSRAQCITLGVVGLVLAASTGGAVDHEASTVWTFDLDRGGAHLITLPAHRALIVDTAPPGDPERGARVLAGAVLATGHRRLQALALPHPQGTHARSIAALTDRLDVGDVWVSPRFPETPPGVGTMSQLTDRGLRLRVAGRGTALVDKSTNGITLETLFPPREKALELKERLRDGSLVFRLSRGNRHVLLAGTLGDAGIARLVSAPEKITVDVLIFPRGGPTRRLWRELLTEFAPRYVVLSGPGDARRRELARRIERLGHTVLATWRGGAVKTAWTPHRGWIPQYWQR